METNSFLIVLGEVNSRNDFRPVFKKLNQPMFVSDKPENELVSAYRNKVYLSVAAMIIAALALVVISANFL
ncbi:MAG: hypothetical protein HC831_02855 [Chloroflexia bacterium]|nr:hypothetical protein [Chloroflexia bacterium]